MDAVALLWGGEGAGRWWGGEGAAIGRRGDAGGEAAGGAVTAARDPGGAGLEGDITGLGPGWDRGTSGIECRWRMRTTWHAEGQKK
jgi:hypothetical protein